MSQVRGNFLLAKIVFIVSCLFILTKISKFFLLFQAKFGVVILLLLCVSRLVLNNIPCRNTGHEVYPNEFITQSKCRKAFLGQRKTNK